MSENQAHFVALGFRKACVGLSCTQRLIRPCFGEIFGASMLLTFVNDKVSDRCFCYFDQQVSELDRSSLAPFLR